mgnify:CR=1 FL=1
MFTYLIINILTILIPFLFSFERRVGFYKKWRFILPAIIITAVIFIVWDQIFTVNGIWGFNPEYLTGIYLFDLPIEELLFFFCIPYACLFIYAVIDYIKPKLNFELSAKRILIILSLIIIILGLVNVSKTYTSVIFITTGIFTLFLIRFVQSDYYSRFLLFFIITLVPFLIVNTILTGGLPSVSPEPIVWYDNTKNLMIRIGTIPIEDFVYNFLLLFLNVTLFDFLRRR